MAAIELDKPAVGIRSDVNKLLAGTQKPRVGAIGDSRLHHDVANYTVVTGSLPYINDTAVPAAGKVAGKSTRGILTWFESLSFGQVECHIYDTQTVSGGQVSWSPMDNQAIGGSVTDALSYHIDRILAQTTQPTHVVIMSGYNDAGLSGIFSDAGAVAALAVAKTNLLTAWARLQSAGIKPIMFVDPPADFAANTFRVKYHTALRNWQRLNAEKYGCWMIDVADAAADPASSVGAPLAVLYAPETPAVHPGPQFCKLAGERLLALFTAKGLISLPTYNQSRQDTYDAVVNPGGNLVSNAGLMLGTSGTFNGSNPPTGQAPTNWACRNNTSGGGTGTIVSSVQARPANKGQGQDWKIVVTATTDLEVWCYIDLGSPVAVGDTLYGSIEVNVDESVNLDRINIYLADMDTGLTTEQQECGMMLGGTAASYGAMPTTFGIRPCSEKMTISSGGGKGRVMVKVYVAAGGSLTMRLGAAEVRKSL